MKKYILAYSMVIVNMLILPILIISLSRVGIPQPVEEMKKAESFMIKTYIKSEDKVMEMDIEEYLYGVVAAEMPAAFPLEALKAQAVAARSYILNKMEKNGKNLPEHKGADVCTDSAHCKAWMSKEERFEKWAETEREKNWNKIETAVNETRGEIMTWGGEPITAVFYAISGGKTENAQDVWGGDVPYLKSAESPLDKNAPNYSSTVTVSREKFKSLLTESFPEMVFGENADEWYKGEMRSEGGGVISCKVGGVTVKGTQMRQIFGLRSHNYTIKIGEDIVFDVVGYGHGVGMSQWGARFYAEEGKSYRDILRIYYSGIEFEQM